MHKHLVVLVNVTFNTYLTWNVVFVNISYRSVSWHEQAMYIVLFININMNSSFSK